MLTIIHRDSAGVLDLQDFSRNTLDYFFLLIASPNCPNLLRRLEKIPLLISLPSLVEFALISRSVYYEVIITHL